MDGVRLFEYYITWQALPQELCPFAWEICLVVVAEGFLFLCFFHLSPYVHIMNKRKCFI